MRSNLTPLARLVYILVLLAASPSFAADKAPGIIKSEYIYEKAPFPSCHASTIISTKSGLVCALFGGTAEGDDDVGIWVSHHDGEKWSEVVEVASGVQAGDTKDGGKRHPCWNPVLFRAKDGPLDLYYKVGPSPDTWWGMKMTSTDDGKTWSKPERLPEGILGPIKNKAVQLTSDTVLSGSSTEHDGWRVHMERSTDGGKTFSRIGPLEGKGLGVIQPTILEWQGGKIQILCRSQQKRIVESWSDDDGKTWSALEKTTLPNPNSGIDAVKLADGRAILIYNHTPLVDMSRPRGREMINVALSDDGRNWRPVAILENEKGEFSYPAAIQSPDGLVHVTYTHQRLKVKHVVIDPAKLKLDQFTKEGNWPGL